MPSFVLVTTDDPTVVKIAERQGLTVPWLRPAHLCDDTSSSVDTCLHALEWFEREVGAVEAVLLLQPTSPFRKTATVVEGIRLFQSVSNPQVVGVSRARSHPNKCFSIVNMQLRPFIRGGTIEGRTQDLTPAYCVNGAFYMTSPASLRATRSFYAKPVAPLIMNETEGLDIDSETDWMMAEAIAAAVGA